MKPDLHSEDASQLYSCLHDRPFILANDSETTRVFVSLIKSARVSSCRTLSLSAQKLIYRQLVQLIWLLKFACRALASKSCADMRILYFLLCCTVYTQ